MADYIWKPQGVKGHWDALPKAAQIAIIGSALGTGALLLLLLTFCCIKQRRAGRREKAIADAEFEKGEAELMEFRRQNSANGYMMRSATFGSQVGDRVPQVPKLPQVSITEPGRPMKSGWL
jgi:hypothetical protein